MNGRDDRLVPEWARDTAFPEAPERWGWEDSKGRRYELSSEAELISAIRDDRKADVTLVWTPEHQHMVLPEELDVAAEAVISSRRDRAEWGRQDGKKWSIWIGGGLVVYVLYLMVATAMQFPGAALLERVLVGFHVATSSLVVGVGLLVLLIVGFIPWYQNAKRLRELKVSGVDQTKALIPVLRFETWMDYQKTPVTKGLIVIIGVVGLLQLLPGNSIQAAGLVKNLYQQGEWWRLYTYSVLHGNLIHFLMNMAALSYLGKRLEIFAKWPHLLIVFVVASLVGGECSARWLEATTVGSSGGLMGWLGFLLVFESLHQRLVPLSAREQLLAGVVLTAVFGLVGYKFIDNAVHAGGLVAGMLYAALVFIKSKSAERPRVIWMDVLIGGLAGITIVATAVVAALLLV